MFNRAVKITALLVGVTAITSIFSSASVEAATKLESKEGRFDSAAVNYGRYIYDGYKGENDSDIYVSDGKEDKVVENADDYNGKFNIKCGDKYVFTMESGSTYLTDISSGAIMEDKSVEDIQRDVASALKKMLKSTDRYGKDLKIPQPLESLDLVRANCFGEVWFKYILTPGKDAEKNDEVINDKLYGFVSTDGRYIDVCNKANLTVVVSNGDNIKTVKIDEFGKEKNGITAKLQSIDAIAQDKDYIYAITDVEILGDTNERTERFLQKISKTSEGNKDGANIPKTVNSYIITRNFDEEDDDKAEQLITSAFSEYAFITKSFNIEGDSKEAIFLRFNPYTDQTYYFTVVNGVLYVVHQDKDEVKVTKLTMKKEKAIYIDGLENKSDNKLDVGIVKYDDDESHDITKGSNISIDVFGNIWGINKGKIFKFDGLKAEDVYTCDTSFDRLDVFNEINLIAWNTDDEAYSEVITGPEAVKAAQLKEAQAKENQLNENKENDAEMSKKASKPENKAVAGWVQDNGKWYFKNADGTNKTSWLNEGGNWYHFNNTGEMETGMIYIEEKGYYLNPKSDGTQGVMKKGWENINNKWYYFNPVNDLNGYEGMMLTGWRFIGDKWYYFYKDGSMASNTKIDGYSVNDSGAWVK